MSNKIDNIIGNEEIFLYPEDIKIRGGNKEISPFFSIGLFVLAIITFVFLYFSKNAKPLQEILEEFREWVSNKSTKFFTYLHVEGQTIRKVIT
jgi:hypothetical protein